MCNTEADLDRMSRAPLVLLVIVSDLLEEVSWAREKRICFVGPDMLLHIVS